MPDLRKFPLFYALLPFLCGLMLSFATRIPVSAGIVLLLVPLLFGAIARIRCSDAYRRPAIRLIFAQTVWFSAGVLVFSAGDFRGRPDGVHRFLEQEVLVAGEIREVKRGIGGKQQLLLETETIYFGDSSAGCSGKIVLQVMDDRKLFGCGEVVLTGGKLLPVTALNNPGEFDAVSFYRSRRIEGTLFTSSDVVEKTGMRSSLNSILTSWRDFLAAKMEEQLDGTFLAISKALILGDKSDLDAETMSAFSTTGSMHVLAVSGLHIGLILVLFQRVLGLFPNRITKRQSIVLAIVLIWVYGGITGASPAVMRAVVMFTILSGAQLMNRQSNQMNVLGFSAVLLLSFDPWMLFDLGFQLSYAAMLGIFLLYRPLADAWTPRSRILQMGWEGTAVGFAATILTTPLILFWFYQFPNYFALANIGVMLFGFAVLMLGMIFLFTGWIPYLVKLVAVVFAFSIFGLVLWVEWVDSLPGAVSGGFHLSGWQVLIAYALITCWIVHLQFRKGKRLLLMFATVLLVAWWAVSRTQVLHSREWIIFNSNQFVAVIKVKNEIYGCYDHKWNGSWKVPRELESYARYTGCRLHILRLEHAKTTLRIGKEKWLFSHQKEGIRIRRGKDSWFYRTGGTPDGSPARGLMTTRLQQYSNPALPTVPFRIKI
jgi:competence protein ComEC